MIKMPPKPVAALVQAAPTDTLKDLHRSTHVAFCRFEAYQRIIAKTIDPSDELIAKLAAARVAYLDALSNELAAAKGNR